MTFQPAVPRSAPGRRPSFGRMSKQARPRGMRRYRPLPMYVASVRTALRTVPLRAVRINHAAIRSMSSAPYRTVATPNAPGAIGPYSQGVVHNGTAYLSGCIPLDPKTMQIVEGGVEAQAEQVLKNLMAVLEAAGSDKSHVLKVTVFMKDMNDFAKVNVRCSANPDYLRKGLCSVQACALGCRGRAPAEGRARRDRVHRRREEVTRFGPFVVRSAGSLYTSPPSSQTPSPWRGW